MGQSITVTYPDAQVSWEKLAELLATRGVLTQLRMIDGELALPGELPADQWRELRASGPGGMVSLRREPGQVAVVVWGNADATLLQGATAVAWAVACVTDGTVTLDGRPYTPADLPADRLPPSFHAGGE